MGSSTFDFETNNGLKRDYSLSYYNGNVALASFKREGKSKDNTTQFTATKEVIAEFPAVAELVKRTESLMETFETEIVPLLESIDMKKAFEMSWREK